MMVKHWIFKGAALYGLRKLSAAALLLAAAAAFGADAPPASAPVPASSPALSPAVLAAFNDLSAEDFKTRQGALAKLQLALGEQMRSLVDASDDPEVQSRLAQLLQFNEGLMHWALDTLKLPADQRKAQLNFGLSPEVLPIMANTFAQDVETRIDGVKALGKLPSEEATALLARLLDDPQRPVYIAAMEAVWDRKPTDAVVDSLWNRAVESGFMGTASRFQNSARQAAPQITFHGQPLIEMYATRGYRDQDSGIACDVLINLKAPQLAEKFKTLPVLMRKAAETSPWVMNGNTQQTQNLLRLVEAYKSSEAIAALYQIVNEPVRQRSMGQTNGEKFYWSNRTAALATVVEVTDQKPEDYKLKRSRQMSGIWTAPTEEDENAAMEKLREWMAAHGAQYGIKEAAHPATQPAESPATQPAPPDAPPQIKHLPEIGPGPKRQAVVPG